MKKIISNNLTKSIFGIIILFLLIILIFENKLILILCYEEFSFWLYPENENRNGELFKIILSVIGGIAIFFSLYVALRRAKAIEKGVQRQSDSINIQTDQINISRKAQTDERFKNAVEHLGSNKEPVILGGIAELHQIAKDNTIDYAEIVFNILCSFIRSNAKIDHVKTINTTTIQTIIDYLFKASNLITNPYINLKANLSKTDLELINLDYANLSGSDLTSCGMPSMTATNLEHSDLSFCVFFIKSIKKVSFKGAKMYFATFTNTKVSNCNMEYMTDFSKNRFLNSELKNIKFNDAEIVDNKFIATDIIASEFKSTNLISNIFFGSYLSKLNFTSLGLCGDNDFRMTGFNNVDFVGSVITKCKFNGCRKGESYRYKFIDMVYKNIDRKSDISGIRFPDDSYVTNCNFEELTETDCDYINSVYNECGGVSKSNSKS